MNQKSFSMNKRKLWKIVNFLSLLVMMGKLVKSVTKLSNLIARNIPNYYKFGRYLLNCLPCCQEVEIFPSVPNKVQGRAVSDKINGLPPPPPLGFFDKTF